MTTQTVCKTNMNDFLEILATYPTKDSSEKGIQVACKTGDVIKGIKKFYVLKDSVLFDPKNEFKPVTEKKGVWALNEKFHPQYEALKDIANDHFEFMHNEFKNLSANSDSSNDVLLKTITDLNNALQSQKRLQNETEQINTDIIAENVAILAENKDLKNKLKKQENSPEKTMLQTMENMLQTMKDSMPNRIEITINNAVIKTVENEVFHEKFKEILILVEENIPVMLTGEAGCGKSEVTKQIAKAKGLKWVYSNAITKEYQLTGSSNMKGEYIPSTFYNAWVNGYLFFIDEIDASIPEALIILNTALAQGEFDFPIVGNTPCHPNFRIISAGNTNGKGATENYSARNELDGATIDRFIDVEMTYDSRIEKLITNDNMDLLELVWNIREISKEENCDLNVMVTYRALAYITKLEKYIDDEYTLETILKRTIVKSMDKDTLTMLVENLTVSKDNQYFKALKKLA
jgi:cobaltochelatase CobS